MNDPTDDQISTTDAELWRPIPGYEGYYEASNLGRIRSVDLWMSNSHRTRSLRGRVLTPTLDRNRLKVSISVEGKRRYVLASRLIGMAWLGVPPDGHRIAHISEDQTDNRIENLTIMSVREIGIRNGRRNLGKTRDVCQRGLHPLTGSNVSVNRNGSRQCLACRQAAARAWREARKTS